MDGSIEQKTGGVQTISESWVVAGGIPGVQKRKERRVSSHTLGIDGLKLRRRRGFNVSARIRVLQLAAAERVAWHQLLHLPGTIVVPTFIVKKEKQFVFEDRPADASPELIPVQSRLLQSILVVEKVVRCKQRIPVVFMQGPMPIVCAAFGYQADLPAAASSKIRCRLANHRVHFIDGVDWSGSHRPESLPSGFIVHVQAIQCDIPLVSPRSRHRTLLALKIVPIFYIGVWSGYHAGC
jgi:hypothetical protein